MQAAGCSLIVAVALVAAAQETVQAAAVFAESLPTFAKNAKLKQLEANIVECKKVVVQCAVLFLEMCLATACSKGMRDWKIKDEKIKAAVANVDVMLSVHYETVSEDDNMVNPVLLRIARDAIKP